MHLPSWDSAPGWSWAALLSLPLVSEMIDAPAHVTTGAIAVAVLGAVAALVKAVADPRSLRRQVSLLAEANASLRSAREADRISADRHHRECRDEVHSLRDEVQVLHTTLYRLLGESPQEFNARPDATPADA